jgi:hypothetical protein
MAYGVNDAIAALARNIRFGDEGDRLELLDFLGRDDDSDPFRPVHADREDDSPEAPAQTESDVYDPSTHNVTEVNDYLADVSDAERNRVLSAERAGKNRASLTG